MEKLLFVLGIISNIRYENSIHINAPIDIVFGIIDDYPNIIPDFHDNVRIISENRTGLGVRFINNSAFGGHKIESIFEVVEYKFNEYIKLENKTHYGSTELIVNVLGDNKTRYIMINYTRAPNFMKNRLFNAFDNELEIIKRISEYNFNNR